MDRRKKVELFEQIRREYEHGVGTIRAVANKLGIHRRMYGRRWRMRNRPRVRRPSASGRS